MDAFQAGSLDGGAAWLPKLGVSGATAQSANASVTPLVITDAPDTDKRIVLDDLELSVDTDMKVTLRTTTDQVIIGVYFMPANSAIQITTRGKKRAPATGRTLEVLTSVAGNVAVTALYHSEP